ncbi:MAG TPA: ATPase domain-containing protein [Anaerolineae bacterium]|nr:ATPase domain-containing protein [Anaerolineae bacterium]
MGSEQRQKQPQLEMTVAALQGRYGPWAVARGPAGRAAGSAAAVPHIPTGFEALDRALGTGGLPKGGVCEVVGPATSGKTTLALRFLAQAQRGGSQVAYIDQARYFDADYAHRCGVDLSHLLAGAPQDLAEALAMAEALARCGSLAAMVLDTVDFLWGDAAAARLLAATLSRLRPPLVRSGTVLLVLHDSPDARSPALSALAHTATVRLQVVRESWIRQYGDVRGYKARVDVLKNRHGPAGQAVRLAIELSGAAYGSGI